MAGVERKRSVSAVGAKATRPVEIPAADHWLHQLIHIAEDVFDKGDLAVVFTALKPTCRLFHEDIKAIQERLAEEFFDDLYAAPSVAEGILGFPERWEYYNLDEEGQCEYGWEMKFEVGGIVGRVCQAAFGPEYDKARDALIHMDEHVDWSMRRWRIFDVGYGDERCDGETIDVYRCFAAAQALVARKESDP